MIMIGVFVDNRGDDNNEHDG